MLKTIPRSDNICVAALSGLKTGGME